MSHNPKINNTKYFVHGGVYKDTTFKEVLPGTYEHYGPFTNYKDAYDTWKARSWLNVDNCHHKLFVGSQSIFSVNYIKGH